MTGAAMQRYLSPVCLVLCLALLVTGFALLAIEAPEPNVALHRARAAGDRVVEEVLDRELARRIWRRRAVIGAAFAAALALAAGAFFTAGGTPR